MKAYNHVHIEHYDTIKKFLATINSRENNEAMKTEHYANTSTDKDFIGTKTYEEATELITKGWTEVLPRIKEQFDIATKGNKNGAIDRRRTYNHVVGYAPNVPNAILGLPQSMINQKKEAQKVKVVSIAYAPTANCGTKAEDFIKAGIVVLNIVNRLELNGIRTQLNIITSDCEKNRTFCNCSVTIKDYREQLDLQKVAFPIAHPSMLRRFGFKWLETVPDLQDTDFRGGYGHTCSMEKDHKELLVKHNVIKDTDYFLELGMISDCGFNISNVIKTAGIEI